MPLKMICRRPGETSEEYAASESTGGDGSRHWARPLRKSEQGWLHSESVRRVSPRLSWPGEEVDIMPRISAGGFSDRINDKICSQISCKINCVLLKRYFRLCCKIALAKWNVTFPGIFVLD